MILDSTCGYKIMWRSAKNPYRLYCKIPDVFIDIRKEVKPTMLADLKHLPFKNNIFELIFFDPPHTQLGKNSIMLNHYGTLTTSQFNLLVIYANSEFDRCLKENGKVIVKLCDRNNRINMLNRSFKNFRLIKTQLSLESKDKYYKTYWFEYKKMLREVG